MEKKEKNDNERAEKKREENKSENKIRTSEQSAASVCVYVLRCVEEVKVAL